MVRGLTLLPEVSWRYQALSGVIISKPEARGLALQPLLAAPQLLFFPLQSSLGLFQFCLSLVPLLLCLLNPFLG